MPELQKKSFAVATPSLLGLLVARLRETTSNLAVAAEAHGPIENVYACIKNDCNSLAQASGVPSYIFSNKTLPLIRSKGASGKGLHLP